MIKKYSCFACLEQVFSLEDYICPVCANPVFADHQRLLRKDAGLRKTYYLFRTVKFLSALWGIANVVNLLVGVFMKTGEFFSYGNWYALTVMSIVLFLVTLMYNRLLKVTICHSFHEADKRKYGENFSRISDEPAVVPDELGRKCTRA